VVVVVARRLKRQKLLTVVGLALAVIQMRLKRPFVPTVKPREEIRVE